MLSYRVFRFHTMASKQEKVININGSNSKEKAVDNSEISVQSSSASNSEHTKSSSEKSLSESDSEVNDDDVSYTSSQALANDPLFFVLSQMFVTSETRKGIADLLEELIDVLKAKS